MGGLRGAASYASAKAAEEGSRGDSPTFLDYTGDSGIAVVAAESPVSGTQSDCSSYFEDFATVAESRHKIEC